MTQLLTHIDEIYETEARMERAQIRYGNFASTHEALGVALEEWDELRAVVQANAIGSVREEALDLAAVLIRLAHQCRTSSSLRERSIK